MLQFFWADVGFVEFVAFLEAFRIVSAVNTFGVVMVVRVKKPLL